MISKEAWKVTARPAVNKGQTHLIDNLKDRADVAVEAIEDVGLIAKDIISFVNKHYKEDVSANALKTIEEFRSIVKQTYPKMIAAYDMIKKVESETNKLYKYWKD